MKHAVIHCTQPVRGTLYFFVSAAGEEHFLFSQGFRASLWSRYRFGVRVEEALDFGNYAAHPADRKLCEKLFRILPYIEKEYGLPLLRKSRSARPRRRDRFPDDDAA